MIFIHSGFRTSSTHVWEIIRKDVATLAYCEIFNEQLERLCPKNINDSSFKSWNSKHPNGAPYFLEYLNFLRDDGGVIGFDPSFSYERAVPSDGPQGNVSEAEANYVKALISHAENQAKIPVLTTVHSLGRVTGLKAAAPGLHILLYRNLFQQWCSYTEQAKTGTINFILSTNRFLQFGSHDDTLKNLSNMFHDPNPSENNINSFYLFIFMHLYFYAHAAGSVDKILDVNRVATDIKYRHSIENLFQEQGVSVDFSGTQNSIAYCLAKISNFAEMAETIRVIGHAVISKAPSSVGRLFAIQVMEELLGEFDRHTFYTRATCSLLDLSIANHEKALTEIGLLRQEHDNLNDARHAALAEVEVTRNEHNNMHTARDAALAEAERARNERDDMSSERDAALAETDTVRSERDQLRATRDAALVEAEHARSRHEDLRIARDAALAETDKVKNERDQLLAARDAALVEAEHARSRYDDLRIVRDAALAEIDTVKNERDQLLAARDAALAAAEHARSRHDDLRIARDAALAETGRVRSERDQLRAARDNIFEENGQTQKNYAELETRYAQLLHWSVAFHDSTARSLSWRMTKPLRWLRIGRPRRPQKPSFLD